MRTDIELWELAAPAFLHALPALMEIYAAAMEPPREQLAGRRSIMREHARNARFRSVIALPRGNADAAGFGYGFHGHPGQWWHDIVSGEVCERDPEAERRWFGDSFEVAELHVLPGHQGRGIGRGLLEALTAARKERTAALSTPAGPTVARSLYLSCGFVDVLPEFHFPGSPHRPFTIMAAPLPLRASGRRRPARRSPAWQWTG
ncbi:GNAT family N-acetyltransferase [Streptomonospora litoralis]|uniref:Acetyltransferase (GNAT) family protein n=1 Tax=Streptomonospora litoralis TaxID=2498135 RepID=A0A4P6Q504_9ACTN|nr:GNAT family N-acetyltransferase [Streptomonospora litoralis]QBI53827.1 Acetyltransferase (GNAT) family protein [Streptomonospora litoralis]